MMTQMGYDRALSVALICASAMIAPIIPPSIPFILYGVAGQVSIGRLFMAGIAPGLILSGALMIFWYFLSRRNNFPVGKKATIPELIQSFKKAVFALVMPVIIVGGIRFGVFTPTEAGCIAVMYALFISVFIYRELKLQDIAHVLVATAKTTGQVLLVAATATSVAWVVTTANLPMEIANVLSGFATSALSLLLIVNFFLVFLGMVMDLTPAMLIFTPIFVPLIKQAGIDPVYFGVIMTLNLVVGLITPPVGTVLYVGCGVGNISLGELVKKIWPLIAVELVVLLSLIIFPELILTPLSWFTK
jgi:tripartite ATP-independent transporter DctM subunit